MKIFTNLCGYSACNIGAIKVCILLCKHLGMWTLSFLNGYISTFSVLRKPFHLEGELNAYAGAIRYLLRTIATYLCGLLT